MHQTAHPNLPPPSTSRCPSMMVSIIEIVLYTKLTAEHQYLLRSSSHPLQNKRAFPFSLALRIPDAYVSSTRRTISVSSTRSHAACLYYHTHSHKRLTQTYPFSCRIAPSDSLNIINFHKHIYILSSSQLCATLFKYIPLVTFLRTNKLTPEIR